MQEQELMNMAGTVPEITLNGVEMPALGFGVYQIPEDETERAVLEAVLQC
jgi:2,5-diketo-D-gluconate reductase A